MGQTTINVRIDENVKKQFDNFCNDVGMNTSVAINLFMKTVVREQRIPFEISTLNDPFYSEANQAHIRKVIAEMKQGKNLVTKTFEELEAMENE